MDRQGWFDNSPPSWGSSFHGSSFHDEFERRSREMKEESDRFFTFFWIFFGFMVLVAFLCSLKRMCDERDKERNRRNIRNACGSWATAQPVHPSSGMSHESSRLASSPYHPTVVSVSDHSYIPERIHELSSAPKDHGSVLIDLPPAYDEVMKTHCSNHTSSFSHADHSTSSHTDHGSSNHCSTDHSSSVDTGCGGGGDTGGSSTND